MKLKACKECAVIILNPEDRPMSWWEQQLYCSKRCSQRARDRKRKRNKMNTEDMNEFAPMEGMDLKTFKHTGPQGICLAQWDPKRQTWIAVAGSVVMATPLPSGADAKSWSPASESGRQTAAQQLMYLLEVIGELQNMMVERRTCN